jgi:broad specificity phosphatase PhoE
MPAWKDMTFRQQAERAIGNVDGLTEEQIADVYAEWEGMTFPDVAEGRTESLMALQDIAMKHLLKGMGKWEKFQERVDNQINKRAK